jgi:hypothetical protein
MPGDELPLRSDCYPLADRALEEAECGTAVAGNRIAVIALLRRLHDAIPADTCPADHRHALALAHGRTSIVVPRVSIITLLTGIQNTVPTDEDLAGTAAAREITGLIHTPTRESDFALLTGIHCAVTADWLVGAAATRIVATPSEGAGETHLALLSDVYLPIAADRAPNASNALATPEVAGLLLIHAWGADFALLAGSQDTVPAVQLLCDAMAISKIANLPHTARTPNIAILPGINLGVPTCTTHRILRAETG